MRFPTKSISKVSTIEIDGSIETQTSRSYQVGINTKIVGKTGADQLSHPGAFRPASLTLQELATHCGQRGHPWMPAVLDKGARRYQQHANHAELLSLDIDSGMTIAEATAHPFISRCCGLGIETSSSTPDHNKFRLVFPLHPSQGALQDYRLIKRCNLYLQSLVQAADKSCKDASRFYFGATERQPFVLNKSATLPESFVQDAEAWHSEQERMAEEQYREALRRTEERRLQHGKPTQQTQIALVELALGSIPSRKPGSGNYDEWMRILAALVHEFEIEIAIALVEKYSPSIQGSSWNVPKKARSFHKATGRPVTLGTLFYIAKSYGFEFPKAERKIFEMGEPNQAQYISYLQTEQERERCDQAEAEERQHNSFSELITKACNLKPKKCRGRVEPIQSQGFTTVTIRDRSEIPEAYQRAVQDGYKHILDRRKPGSGKSHTVGTLDPKHFAVEVRMDEDVERKVPSLRYYTKESRNPSTITVEANFTEVPVRNHGWKADPGKTTPSGKAVYLPVYDAENPIGQGNCQFAHLFLLAGKKNIPAESMERASSHPICAQCPFNRPRPGETGAECANHEGEGFGFRKQFKEAMAHNRIRLNPLSGSNLATAGTIGIYEEISELLAPVTLTLDLNDFNTQCEAIREHNYELATKLYPIEKALRHAMLSQLTRYGTRDEAFFDLTNSFSRDDLAAILKELKPALNRSLNTILDHHSMVNEAAKRHRDLVQKLNRALKKLDATNADKQPEQFAEAKAKFDAILAEALQVEKSAKDFEENRKSRNAQRKTQAIENLKNAPVQGLWHVLNIMFNSKQGVGGFIVNNGKISISLPPDRVLRVINQSDTNIYLDATSEPQILCDKLGIQLEELLVIDDDLPQVTNIQHVQVIGFGKCARERVDSTNEQLKKLDAGICKHATSILGTEDFEVAIADYKDVNAINANHRHLSDTRGSNKSQGKQVLIVHGLPKPNLGAIQNEYATLKNPGYSFEQFYQTRVDAEIQQLAGRLRANLYPEKNFLIFWVTEEPLPFEAEQVKAIDVCYEAAPIGQKTERSIFEAIYQCVRQGRKLTQTVLAQLAGKTQGYISRWFENRGGWKYWCNLLRGKPVEDIEAYRSQLEPEEATITEILSIELEQESDSEETLAVVSEVLECFGADGFSRIWRAISWKYRRRFIGALFTLELPSEMWQELDST